MMTHYDPSPVQEHVLTLLPPYELPPPWIPPAKRVHHPDYNDLQPFLPRTVILHRVKASDALGFNIRGGKEHNFGLYVSKVMPNSEADRLGVKEGDQILQVNGIDFNTLDHSDAVKALKVNTTVKMLIRYFPYGYQKTYDRNPSASEQSPVYTR